MRDPIRPPSPLPILPCPTSSFQLVITILITFGFSLTLALALFSRTAYAASPGIKLDPLKYEDVIAGANVRGGHIDVSNPSDTAVNIEAEVKGFKQADLDGNLEFFGDEPIKEAITLGLNQFELGPREAIRVSFSVDPAKLPRGGVYAAVFFRTVPPRQASGTSFVAESANVGTLLLLQNGPGERIGQVTSFHLPFFQFGAGLSGRAEYKNTNHTSTPIAFSPGLETRVFPWGRPGKLKGPYVLPGSTRRLEVQRPGSYLGLLPVSLIDSASDQGPTLWVFACTGVYAYALLILLVMLAVFVAARLVRRQPLVPRRLRWLFGRRPAVPVKRPMDGISPKQT
ncbi:MAG: exported protein of unknown function [Patescibacteria group bacterium]|nr:exported protein of unknown function [Patescibacteria group bacterium]